MNKTKKLMLAIFSLIAIVSCGEAGKSGDSGSGTSAATPTVSNSESTSYSIQILGILDFSKFNMNE